MPKRVLPTPSAPKAIGPYSVAVEGGGLVFVSGQVGIDPETGEKAAGDVVRQTKRVMDNIVAILGDVGLGMDDVVKSTIFLADINDFSKVNEIYGEYFPEAPPARSTIQAANLPAGFLVEIEVVAARS
jgi:2-iminobutanoate/2-iminopropanoate deaminase